MVPNSDMITETSNTRSSKCASVVNADRLKTMISLSVIEEHAEPVGGNTANSGLRVPAISLLPIVVSPVRKIQPEQLSGSGIIQRDARKSRFPTITGYKTSASWLTADTDVRVAGKRNLCFFNSTTLKTTAISTVSKKASQVLGYTAILSSKDFLQDSKCCAQTATTANTATTVSAPITKVQRLSRKGVRPSGRKRHPALAGADDIVSSARQRAAGFVPGSEVASRLEGKVDYDNQQGIAYGKILGFKKPVFDSLQTGTQEDFGIICVDVAQ